MIFQKFENLDLNNFPVVIFGSGPAGIATALELEKNKISSIEANKNSESLENKITMRQAIRDTIAEEMRKDERVFLGLFCI